MSPQIKAKCSHLEAGISTPTEVMLVGKATTYKQENISDSNNVVSGLSYNPERGGVQNAATWAVP